MKNNITFFVLLVLLVFTSTVFSQTVVCEGSSCTANDYTLEDFYLGDAAGNPFGPGYCEPGNTVNAHIWTNFVANSAASRYTLYLHFNLYVNGEFIATIDECYYDGVAIPTNVTLDVYNFSWECGADIALRDFYMSWRPNSGQACGCSNAKCYSENEIIVLAPLIANYQFNPSCLSAYTLQFNSTTSGGVPPYSFLWDFGDGSSSIEENPLHTYTSTGPYIVSLTVEDTENTDSYEIEIVHFDANLPPDIFSPPNLNIEGCDLNDLPDFVYSETQVEITEAEFNTAGGSLILSNDMVSLSYIDISSGTCPIANDRTYTVIDSCNNTASVIQAISINDTTFPTASNPNPIQVQCISDVPVADINSIIDATDNCSTTTTTFVSDVSDLSSCPEVITRTYSVADACGNTIFLTQQIIVNDDIAPTATNPSNITVACFGDIPSPDISIITDATDNCATPLIEFISDVSDNNSCPIVITRTYRLTDDCQNSIDLTQIITVNDTIAPTATSPPSTQVQCLDDIPVPDTSLITDATDNCATPLVAFVSDTSNNGLCPEIITRIYSVTDDCGNITLLTQLFTVLDDLLPTASSPATINVQCIDDIPAPDTALIIDEADNCSTPTVRFVSDVSTGQCPQIITRTYRVEDSCGNFIDLIQNINVNDDILPTASNPPDLSINCSDGIPTPDTSVVNDATDNCSTPIISFVSDISNGLCPEVITRTYSVSDACGNSINVSHSITFNDTESPTLITPLNDETVNCTAIPSVPNLTFNDNCTADLLVDYIMTNTNMNDTVDYDITHEWTVTDNCGNASVFTQNIHVLIADCLVSQCNSCGPVDDTIFPTASNPVDLIVSCTDAIPPPNINVVIDEADNCVPPTVAFVSEDINFDCFEKVIRIYSVTDECGNVIYVTHNINVVDTILPTASNPNPINVSCSSDIPSPDVEVVTDEADNCSNPVVTFISDISNNACNERITRTYQITDGCGNFITVTQEINVIDDIAPTADPLTNINISCITDVPIPNINIVTGLTDNCSTPSVNFISDISDNNTCPETITRTYRIIDECGNFTDINQLIIITDDIAPTASNPSPIQVSCAGEIPLQNASVVIDEADNCSTPTVTFVSDVSNNLTCPETITRTYRITDACGNSIDVFQDIIINDEIDPTASNLETINVMFSSDIPIPDINNVFDEADNCSIPTVAFVSDVSDNLTCPETIIRTYSVTDACNNSINVIQNIIIIDNENPTASNPNPIVFQCLADIIPADTNIIIDAMDNSGTTTVTFVSESSNNQTCPEIITRIYRVADACGNFIDLSHTLFIDDDISPTASNPPSITVNDVSLIPTPDTLVVIDEADNCGIPTVSFVSEVSNNDPCNEIITRTYSVTDACNNSINVYQDINILNAGLPNISNPDTIYLSCEGNIPAPDTNIIIVDAALNTTTNYISEVSNNQICPEIITRIYRISDNCGNYTEVTHNIIINDEVLPTASNPISIILSDISDLQPANIDVVIDEADNCSIPVVVFESENSTNFECEQVITRIYSVTDACNNSINVSQTITIEDITSPTASDPEPLTINCNEEIPVPNINIIIDAADNMSTPTITFVSESSNRNGCNETITRIYNIADNCGNDINVNHMIYIEDNSAPSLVGVIDEEISLFCDEIPEVPEVEFVDNCATNIVIEYTEETIEIDENNYDIIRSWVANDACLNETNLSQVLHISTNNEFYSNDIELCINEAILDLNTLVNMTDTGSWTTESPEVLNGSLFDPSTTPEGSYSFTYIDITNGCSRTDRMTIEVNDNCIEYPCIKSPLDVSVNKLLTPNRDGRNETLDVSYIVNTGINQHQLCDIIVDIKIFNRWGAIVYESNNYDNEWTGNAPNSSFGNSEKLPNGTYFYLVNLINSNLKPIQGYILLGIEE